MSAAELNRKNFERDIDSKKNPWRYSPKGIEAKQAAMIMLATKTGMFSRVPILCKAKKCPYAKLCSLIPYDLAPEGEYCPQETALIEMRASQYSKDFDIDSLSETDKVMLNEIVALDVMLERCRALMAQEATPVQEITIGVTDNGDEIKQPAVSKAWEVYEKMSKKRDSTYQLMMMTRKDNKSKIDDNTANSLYNILNNVITIEDIDALKK